MSQNRSSTLFLQQWTVQKAGLAPDLNEDACLIKHDSQEDVLMIALGLLLAATSMELFRR